MLTYDVNLGHLNLILWFSGQFSPKQMREGGILFIILLAGNDFKSIFLIQEIIKSKN